MAIKADDLTGEIMAIDDEVRAGRVDDIDTVQLIAKKLAILASHSASLSAAILIHGERMALDREVKDLRKLRA